MGRHCPGVALATVPALLVAAVPVMASSGDWTVRAVSDVGMWLETVRSLAEGAHRAQPTLAVAILVVGVLLPPLALIGLWQRWQSARRARRAITARTHAESATQLIGRSPGRRTVLQLEVIEPLVDADATVEFAGAVAGTVAGATTPGPVGSASAHSKTSPLILDGARAVVRIGHAEDNELRLSQPMVARYHAAIRRESDGDLWLVDIERSNAVPVRLNGERVVQSRLVAGDVVEIGSAKLQLVERVV